MRIAVVIFLGTAFWLNLINLSVFIIALLIIGALLT